MGPDFKVSTKIKIVLAYFFVKTSAAWPARGGVCGCRRWGSRAQRWGPCSPAAHTALSAPCSWTFNSVLGFQDTFSLHTVLYSKLVTRNTSIIVDYRLIFKSSVPDPWHFGTDPHPRIRRLDYGSGSFSFLQWLARCQQKISCFLICFANSFCRYRYIYICFQR
jgi:hypothetical protein